MVADESSITGESDPIKKGFPQLLEENSKI